MTEFLYDVFISHAYEDQTAFANDLAVALKEKGLKVWYSGFELKLGDSIAQSVNSALLQAKFAIVIISPVYLEKQWAMSELGALLSQESDGNRVLPMLHRTTAAAVIRQLPVLADRYSITSKRPMQVIVNKVLQVVKGKRKYVRKPAAKVPMKRKKSASKKDQQVIPDSGFITVGGNVTMNGGDK